MIPESTSQGNKPADDEKKISRLWRKHHLNLPLTEVEFDILCWDVANRAAEDKLPVPTLVEVTRVHRVRRFYKTHQLRK